MTAQIGDIYKHKGKEYSIVAMSVPIGFKPQNYGLNPQSRCTACWSGYWCEYDIQDDILMLKNLFMYNSDGNYPEFNGVNVVDQTYHEAICLQAGKKKSKKIMIEDNAGHREYRNVNLPMKYNGKILLGDDFIQDYYIHMGYQRAWAYKILVEYVFKDGKLVETKQHSETAKRLRAEIDEGMRVAKDNQSIPLFVENSFSLEMKDKAWWIKDN